MSRDKSRGCSDHQVINTVNNPVETHTAAGPRPVVACRRRGRPLWGPRRRGRASPPGGPGAPVPGVPPKLPFCGPVLWARSVGPSCGPAPFCDLPPGVPAVQGRSRARAARHQTRGPGRAKVVHLHTGQPTEVIHRCGDRVGSMACRLENRQPGRSEPGRHSELHACKLLTMWITAVENSPIRTRECRCGGSAWVHREKAPQSGRNRPVTPAGETLENSERGPGSRLR